MSDFIVECARTDGDAVPARLGTPDRLHDVAEVLDRWSGTDHRYFRVRTTDGATWIVRFDERSSTWALVFFEATAAPG